MARRWAGRHEPGSMERPHAETGRMEAGAACAGPTGDRIPRVQNPLKFVRKEADVCNGVHEARDAPAEFKSIRRKSLILNVKQVDRYNPIEP
jgi:hypothetical protein